MSENFEKENKKDFAINAIISGIVSIIILPVAFAIAIFTSISGEIFYIALILGVVCAILAIIFSASAKSKDKLVFAARLVAIISIIIYLFFVFILIRSQEAGSIAKPIIYLYPEDEMEVTIELGYNEKITVSYPEYNDGWNVIAQTNGDLTDITSNRSLYSLYYESESVVDFEVEEEGFVVSSEDTAEFLEEKLAILGLTEREAEEFIIYWLPKLQENEYNYIRFATEEEIEENMPLTITPEPDTVIRVLMTYKGLDEPIEVEEQELETPERTGFVAVEWGGTEIE